jgi:hypothetical protein
VKGPRVPLVLTPAEFGAVVRLHPRVVSKYCHPGRIKAQGPKWRIPIAELDRWGVSREDAVQLLAELKIEGEATPAFPSD